MGITRYEYNAGVDIEQRARLTRTRMERSAKAK